MTQKPSLLLLILCIAPLLRTAEPALEWKAAAARTITAKDLFGNALARAACRAMMATRE